ncbi:cell division protein FtsH [Candidatus Marinamargulisbacteria bacterium SCGC AG-414-C22]|nr:cell division protein FtsH [Candidatus Marinamargulisbacteria bacterium SCGC AG-414-C22]
MALSILSTYFGDPKAPTQIPFTEFMQQVETESFVEVTLRPAENILIGQTKNGEYIKTYYVDYPGFVAELREQNIKIKVNPSDGGWVLSLFMQALLPFLLIAGLWFFIFRQAQGMNSQAMSFGKSRAVPWKDQGDKKITFKDVAGLDEAIEELKEIVDFLKSPKRYQQIGAKIPKGALLMGPPGTGKTLLAKAIAGEADVPFFSLSGSDFVEMFVGVGASRVRDLFGQAKKKQPCLIFVDEIDAVGRHRGAGLGGGHDEREQTLNQLLVEMDGFDPKQTIIVIAATNRPDILDPALLRPGRFDRQIVVDKPDVKGRHKILKIHAKEKKIEKKVDLEVIAKRTPGFTGADLANLINESALLAARKNKTQVSMEELEESTDRVMAGPERKSRVISKKEKEIIAFHELGHAIVAAELPNTDPVHKISILPRGMALGYVLQLPIEDKYLVSTEEIKNQLRILMGGRIAEDLIFNEITSGASNDIEKATSLAQEYVCNYGMSKLGARKFGKSQQQVFLGKGFGESSKDYSDSTAKQIDDEIKALLSTSFDEAQKILKKNLKVMKELSKILLEKEVIEGKEFLKIFKKIQDKHFKPKPKKTVKKKVEKKVSKIDPTPGGLKLAQA